MRKYAFIVGRARNLCIAEIICALETEGQPFSIENQSEFALIIYGDIDTSFGAKLGGTIKISEIFFETSIQKSVFFKKKIEKIRQIADLAQVENTAEKPKCIGISIYPDSYAQVKKIYWQPILRIFGSHIKQKFLGKPNFFIAPPTRKEPFLSSVEINKKRPNPDISIILCGNTLYFGKTIFTYNPFEFSRRDMEKKGRKYLLPKTGLLSPKLARILVNLAKVKAKDIVLDPFCGSGTILQEARIRGANVFGIDIDEKCIEYAKLNVASIKIPYEQTVQIQQGDAQKLPFPNVFFDAIVTEPFLGHPLSKKPTYGEAERIVQELTPLYQNSFLEIFRTLKSGSRAVIIFPVFIFKEKKIGVNIDALLKNVPLKRVHINHGLSLPLTFIDKKLGQKLAREIHILEKNLSTGQASPEQFQ
jgi:tRNA G10  N-methylase Trm11